MCCRCAGRGTHRRARLAFQFRQAIPRLAIPCPWTCATSGVSARPAEGLHVHMENWRDGKAALRRHVDPETRADDRRGPLARALLRFPLMTAEGERADPLAGAEALAAARAVSRASARRDRKQIQTQHEHPISTAQRSIWPRRRATSLLARLGRRLLLEAACAASSTASSASVEPTAANMCSAGVSEDSDVGCTLYIDHAQTYADAAFGGTVGAGEAYIRGLWHCDDLDQPGAHLRRQSRADERHRFRLVVAEPPAAETVPLGESQQPATAARATSPRTTTSATISTSSCSTTPWPIPAPSFRAPDAILAEGIDRQVRSGLPQARSEAHGPRARDRHAAGAASPSTPRSVTAAASPPPRSRARSTTTRNARSTRWDCPTASPCCCRTIAISSGQLRQAGVDRDGRSRRRATSSTAISGTARGW